MVPNANQREQTIQLFEPEKVISQVERFSKKFSRFNKYFLNFNKIFCINFYQIFCINFYRLLLVIMDFDYIFFKKKIFFQGNIQN